MKKLLLTCSLSLLYFNQTQAQCVYTCSNYAVSEITFSTFPSNGPDVVSTFTAVAGGDPIDDGATGAIPIGFPFEFYCNTYNNVYIVSNGFIQFDFAPVDWSHGPYVHTTQNIPTPVQPNGMVAFNMTDFDPNKGGTITYTTVGVAPNRMFIVTYSNVPCFTTPTDLNTGQIVLYETTNMIEIHTSIAHGDQNQTGTGTQGIENTTGSDAKSSVFSTGSGTIDANANSSWFSHSANKAVLFSPYSAPPLAPVVGNSVLCQGTQGNYQVQPATGALSYSWSAPGGWMGSSTTTAVSYTASTSGIVAVTADYTCGASPASTIAVTVNPSPVVSIDSYSPAIMCSGIQVSLTVSGGSNYTVMPGNIVGTGPVFTDVPMTSTTYSLTGDDANGCISFNNANASVLVLESPTVSVNSGAICEGETFTITPTGADDYDFSSTFSQVKPDAGIHTYSVTGTATNGCVSDVAISSITVSPMPDTEIDADRSSMCTNESVILTASGADSYIWSHTTLTTATVSVKPKVSGHFTVTGVSADGCTSKATQLIMVSPCTGLEELNGYALRVYPNPSSGAFLIESGVREEIQVTDISGRTVHFQILNEGTNAVDLSHLSRGNYVLKGMETGQHRSLVIIQ